MKRGLLIKTSSVVIGLGALLALPAINRGADDAAATKSVTGEIVDLMCYIDHGAKGEKHKGCAEKCIKSGGPVGLLSGEDLYLVIGDHKPMNDELADYAGKTITVKGKMASNGGITMLENAEIVKK